MSLNQINTNNVIHLFNIFHVISFEKIQNPKSYRSSYLPFHTNLIKSSPKTVSNPIDSHSLRLLPTDLSKKSPLKQTLPFPSIHENPWPACFASRKNFDRRHGIHRRSRCQPRTRRSSLGSTRSTWRRERAGG